MKYSMSPIEFGGMGGGSAVVPTIALTTCEQTGKERIIRLENYHFLFYNFPFKADFNNRYFFKYLS
jgi:hypothetical protein